MEKRQDLLAPFAFDDCPNSGEDSDEDIITDYLGSELTDCSHASGINGEITELNINDNMDNKNKSKNYTKYEITLSPQEENNDINLPSLTEIQKNNHQVPVVPTISVTPNSPGFTVSYPVLEDNLQQLQEIQKSIQRMRVTTLAHANPINNDNNIQRLSSSCPSLCPQELVKSKHDLINNYHGSDPDLTNCSTNSSPTHYHNGNKKFKNDLLNSDRRRSWTDVEKTRKNNKNNNDDDDDQNHLQARPLRERSISLSSLDSEIEIEIEIDDKSSCVNVANRSCRSQISTHSLNEADFVQIDLKDVAKRKSQRLIETDSLLPGVTGSRLPLQKSISTPSIVSPAGQNLAESEARNVPSVTRRHERNEKGSGSETETEDIHTTHRHVYHQDLIREGSSNVQASLEELMTDGATYDDHHSEKNSRRKRGSIFFRKKKDKSVKKTGSDCGTTINQSFKDQITNECTKSKSNSTKNSIKSISSVSLGSGIGHVKRGSTVSLPPQGLTRSNSKKELNNKKTVTSYSPWRRVATKLGVNQTINEEKDCDVTGQREILSASEEFDFGDEVHRITVDDIEGLDPELGLKWDEPDSWSASFGRSDALRRVDNNEREVKRQEHIYEFVLTEKHHCLVLLSMERIFAEGLRRYFRLGPPDIDRMFPRLRDLIDIHLNFLSKLRKRQSTNAVVPTIADILIEQFSGDNSLRMKSAYGEFCSRHRDAVDSYKYYMNTDVKFAKFIRLCQTNPLLKKKGIPECILFVTQRLTKYPLLVEPLIKTATIIDEKDNLHNALKLVKEILNEVDACVADKQREDRKLEIYNRIDAKSFAYHRGEKFRKSDILSSTRVLKFEGTANLMQGRGKPASVIIVVLSDVLIFLSENRDQKYVFMPDNKPGVVSLQKLLVREKAGQESRDIFLISSNPLEPEMFELKIIKPKDKQIWIKSIRSAVENCPQDFDNDGNDDDNSIGFTNDLSGTSKSGYSSVSTISTLTLDERLKLAKAKESHIQSIIDDLRKKDNEQALLLQEKMSLQIKLFHASSSMCNENETEIEKTERIEKIEQQCKEMPDYTKWTRNQGVNLSQLWQEVIIAVQEATRLAGSLSYNAHASGSLSRSLSSAGERHTDAFIPPSLCVPRRAETFAGFDHNKERYPWRDLSSVPKPSDLLIEERHHPNNNSNNHNNHNHNNSNNNEKDVDCTEIINEEQQLAAIKLSQYVYKLFSLISNQMSTIDILNAQLTATTTTTTSTTIGGTSGGGGGSFSSGGSNNNNINNNNNNNHNTSIIKSSSQNRPNSNRQLEELRNLQDQLTREKDAFRVLTQQEKLQIQEEKNELSRLREQLAAEQRDVEQQREQLYRRLEALERQGVSLVAPTNIAHPTNIIHTNQIIETTTSSRKSLSDSKRIPERIPMNLISATNQQKAPSSLPPVKQQLPLKLASGSNNNNSGSTRSSTSSIINNSPDRYERHSRTGSSPAAVSTSAYSSPELGNSHNNLLGSTRSLRTTRSPPEPLYTHSHSHSHPHHLQQQHHYQQQPQPQQQQQQHLLHQQQKSEPPQQPLDEEIMFF